MFLLSTLFNSGRSYPPKKIMLDDVRPKNAQGGKNVLRLKYSRELKIEPNSEKN